MLLLHLCMCLFSFRDLILLVSQIVLQSELQLILAVTVDLLQVHCHNECAQVLRRLEIVIAAAARSIRGGKSAGGT